MNAMDRRPQRHSPFGLTNGLTSLLLVGAAALSVLIPSSAWAAAEKREVASFQAILSEGAFEVHVRQADQASVELEGDASAIAMVETVVDGADGGTLRISTKPGMRWTAIKLPLVRIAVPRLTAVGLKGSGDLKLDAFKTPQLRIALSGSGDASLKSLQTERLTLSIAGSGDIKGDGRAQQLKLSIAGSGNARLRAMQADQVNISIAGSGDAEVHAEKALTVSIAGSGDVRYVGSPALKTSVAGSGNVKSLR